MNRLRVAWRLRGSQLRPRRALPLWAAALIASSSLLASLPAPVRAIPSGGDGVAATEPSFAPAGNLVDNGSFESPDISAAPGGFVSYIAGATDITKWTIDQGRVDLVTAPHWAAPDGSQVLDIDGSGNLETINRGYLSQDIPTTQGTAYEVGFVYSGNPDCGNIGNVSMDVYWGALLVGTVTHDTVPNDPEFIHSLPAFDYQAFSVGVTGEVEAEETQLQFRSNSPASATCGIVVDDVYVVHADPPVWRAQGDGTTTVVNDGSSGPPEFTYSYEPGGASGASGSWAFYTTATTSEDVDLDWSYTGFHAFFAVTAGVHAFVTSVDGSDTDLTLLTAGPKNCDHPGCVGDTPSGGFAYSGSTTLTVEPGDTYGFVLSGSNGDINTLLQGRLVINGPVVLPLDCAGVKAANPSALDGEYTIQPTGSEAFSVYCQGMAGTPKEYLSLVATGPGRNFGSYAAGGAAPGTTVTTSFTKVRLNPATLTVDIGDLTYAASSGSLTHPEPDLDPTVTSMPYGTAMACNNGAVDGTANIDLTGTPFAVDDAFTPVGTSSASFGGATFSAANQVVDIAGNGFCGWRTPFPEGPFFVFNPAPGQFGLTLEFALDSIATPSLIRAISGPGNTAFLIGQVDGASETPITLEVRTAAACTAGALVAPTSLAGSPASVTTDPEGYFGIAVTGVVSGDFVAARLTSPSTTAISACVVSSGDNDYWPKALELTGSTLTARDLIDTQGKARWYKFDVTPGQRIDIKLSGLPADYDLAVFKDIGKTFLDLLAPEDTGDLTELSAEYAPSVFSPSVFSPSVFSPSVFSPDAYSPSVFSPSVFSPSVFSPSVFSPSVFSPSVFSPSVFSPSVFSPSVFSPSVFSPSVFSPSVFSPSVFSDADIARAFSSAQTRSIIGVSATPGTGDETVVVNSWNNTGEFYVRVAGHGGAFDTGSQFRIDVAKGATSCGGVTDTTLTPRANQADTDRQTVILTDSSKLALGGTGAGTLRTKLTDLAARTEVAGVLVDVATDSRVQALRTQAANHAACPYAMNLVAEEIKGIVDSYRLNNPLRYVVVVGGDGVIPFFRYPDQSLLGQESGYVPPVRSDSPSEASLRKDFVLSQDAYGAGTLVSLRTSEFPVPGLAVGRLVETPAEISGLLDAYTTANGRVIPASSLVTGYDFLTDAANAVSAELQAGTNATPDTLITPNGKSPEDPTSWTATQLGTKLLGSRHDVIFLAGHFSANSALAADFQTSLLTTDLAASSVNLTNAIVFSAGCHSGYNLVDGDAITGVTLPLDWAQAFAQKRSILIAGTGYQYGDTDFVEYSERLYRDFARELRAGAAGTAVPVGEALVRAKLTYLGTTPDIRGIHEKALLEATLFGLPMFGVQMPAGRGATPGTGSPITPIPVVTEPAASLGLAAADLHLSPTLTPQQLSLKNPPYDALPGTFTIAKWLSGPNGVVTNPAEPALPLVARNATSSDGTYVLRGTGFRGGTYVDTPGIVPLTGAPTTELRGVHAPFVSPVFYPMRLWTPNYYGALGGLGGTNLLVTPVQHKTDSASLGTSIQRAYTNLDLKLFYSGNLTSAALSDAPTIVDVQAQTGVGGMTFTAQVVGDPKAAVHGAWITHTGGTGTWTSLDLTQCIAPLPAACGGTEDSRLWTGTLASPPASLKYVVQAVNGLGLVSFDDNRGAYYAVEGGVALAGTALTLVAPPTSGTFGDSRQVVADLKAGSTGVAGQVVTIAIGGSTVAGTTNGSGRVTLNVPLNSTPGPTQIVASFSGDAAYGPSGASAPFTIAKAPSSLSPYPAFVTQTTSTSTGNVTTLTAQVGGKAQPLIQQTVTFTLTGPVTKTISSITDYLGRADLPKGLPVGTYTVVATFAGDATYTNTSRTGSLLIAKFNGFLWPVANPPKVNVAKAGFVVPLRWGLGGNLGLNILAAGSPTATKITCSTGAPENIVDQAGTFPSLPLTYIPILKQYLYVWKIPKAYAGSCYQLKLTFIDGSSYSALFRFK